MSATATVAASSSPTRRRGGFSPFPHQVLSDWPRLVSGDTQIYSIMLIVSETLGAVPDKQGRKPEWSRSITNEELANHCRCRSVRTVEIAIKDLVDRKVIRRKKSTSGGYAYQVPFETWPELPDRQCKVVAMPTGVEEPEQEPETENDTVAPSDKPIQVFDKLQHVKPGARPKAKQLPALSSQLRVFSDCDITYNALLRPSKGILEVHIQKAESQTNGEENRKALRKTVSKAKIPQESAGDNRTIQALRDYFGDMVIAGQIASAAIIRRTAEALGDDLGALPFFERAVHSVTSITGWGIFPTLAARARQAYHVRKNRSRPEPNNTGCENCVDGMVTWETGHRLARPKPCTCVAGKRQQACQSA